MDKSKNVLKSSNIIITPTDEEKLWDADWRITLNTGAVIGTVSFAGEKALGAVPIHIELAEEYRNQGYGTQVLRMMVDWAFRFRNVYEVKAVTEHENDKCVKALERAGFVFRSGDRHVEYYSVTKNKTSWTGLYVMIGIVVGIILGIVLGSPKLGMGMGLVVSLAIGLTMDSADKKERERVLGRKEE